MAVSKILTNEMNRKQVARAWTYEEKNEHGISFGTKRDVGPVDSIGALCCHYGTPELSIDIGACEKQEIPIVIIYESGKRFRVTRDGKGFPSFLLEESKKEKQDE